MGATNFVEVMQGYDSADEAYSEAVSQAIYEYGHDPYNGTISTTNGYQYLGEVDTFTNMATTRITGQYQQPMGINTLVRLIKEMLKI